MIFGERLKQLRDKKYSQEDLANMLHVHHNTISRWENGTQIPRMSKVKELAKILGTTTSYLFGETDNQLSFEPQEKVVSDASTVSTIESSSSRREIPSVSYWDEVKENVDDVLIHGSRELIFYMYVALLNAISKIPPEIRNSFSLSGISAYNGNNSSYNAAVMSVNASVDVVKGA